MVSNDVFCSSFFKNEPASAFIALLPNNFSLHSSPIDPCMENAAAQQLFGEALPSALKTQHV